MDDIKDTYDAKRNSDVLLGKRTEQAVLNEFLETFEAHHNMMNNQEKDAQITPEEFLDYYKSISASIDDDNYFALMMNNSWNLKEDANTYKKYEKGWANEDAQKPATA